MSVEQGWTPAFPGQRPPFEPGNEYRVGEGNDLATRHGAHSDRVIAPVARQIVEQTLADPSLSYLAAPRYSAVLEAWARAEARVRVLTTWLEQQAADGVGDYQANRGAFDELHRAETRAASERRELGLTPLAAARLGKDIAVQKQADAATVLTELRERNEREKAAQVIDHD